MNLERKKKSLARQSIDELAQEQNKFIELQEKNIALTETLQDLKHQELELMKEVAEVIVSPAQKKTVQIILDEVKVTLLQVTVTNQIIKESEMKKTTHAKKAVTEVSGYIDELLEKKEESDK